jgi:thioester reductase-like protein
LNHINLRRTNALQLIEINGSVLFGVDRDILECVILLFHIYFSSDVPVDIYRLGQIAGDSETGVWNTAEMIPLIICAGGGEMSMLPDDCQCVDWIPVNYAAACVADIAIDPSTRTAPISERVHHIVNPRTISWPELLKHLKAAGLHFTVVPIKDWLRVLLSSPKNPAYVLAGFFQKIFAEGTSFELAKYLTEKTARRTTALEHCPTIDRELVQCYLNYWSETGFLKQGYSRTK